ncbi:MAG: GNAT family N-acetyltransferase [Aphanothece sp. CMT-3BRIN-NPC111]|nr:GNAT family N-acetyltransferase [Aphanothece sp. CMT-3BRIN-NPC111]
MQQSFVEDPSLSDRLFDLLETVFPEIGLRQLANIGRKLGAPWESASVPFMKFEEGRALAQSIPRIIAHVGVVELPLCVMGQPLKVGGIHAVATHPEFRRRGHYRDCMEAALEYCKTRYETLVLTTSQPELYQPFGFRVVPEFAFMVPCDHSGQKDSFRVLNLQDVNDCTLLHRLLDTRIPVSDVVGVYSEKAVFLVNEASRPLYYAEDLDALVVIEQEDDRLQLFDVIANHSLSLADILKCISHPVNEVILYFSPDRLNVQAKAIPYVLDDAYLMIRGSFAAEGQPFMLPRSARC